MYSGAGARAAYSTAPHIRARGGIRLHSKTIGGEVEADTTQPAGARGRRAQVRCWRGPYPPTPTLPWHVTTSARRGTHACVDGAANVPQTTPAAATAPGGPRPSPACTTATPLTGDWHGTLGGIASARPQAWRRGRAPTAALAAPQSRHQHPRKTKPSPLRRALAGIATTPSKRKGSSRLWLRPPTAARCSSLYFCPQAGREQVRQSEPSGAHSTARHRRATRRAKRHRVGSARRLRPRPRRRAAVARAREPQQARSARRQQEATHGAQLLLVRRSPRSSEWAGARSRPSPFWGVVRWFWSAHGKAAGSGWLSEEGVIMGRARAQEGARDAEEKGQRGAES